MYVVSYEYGEQDLALFAYPEHWFERVLRHNTVVEILKDGKKEIPILRRKEKGKEKERE